MKLSEKILKIAQILKKTYPDADCELDFSNTLQLLVAVILSAQCTDKRVNLVTPSLFKKYKTVQDFAHSELSELENLIKSTGFYRNKAKNIKACCEQILAEYGEKIPESMEKLVVLPGVGRKTANVVRMHGFNLPGLSVDTHFQRLCKRLGLITQTDPVKIEEVNLWNSQAKFTRLVQIDMKDKTSLSLESQLDCLGGVTEAGVRQFVNRFDREANDFSKFIGKK